MNKKLKVYMWMTDNGDGGYSIHLYGNKDTPRYMILGSLLEENESLRRKDDDRTWWAGEEWEQKYIDMYPLKDYEQEIDNACEYEHGSLDSDVLELKEIDGKLTLINEIYLHAGQ